MIEYWKPVGAFIENTIRPLIGEAKWFLDECEKKGINLNETNIKATVDYCVRSQFRTVIAQCVRDLLIVACICLTYLASRS
jgi:hypothetical protein